MKIPKGARLPCQSHNTTNIYAEVDLEMKAKALALCEVAPSSSKKRWREDAGLMDFLRAL
jgi:integrase/recombinase XerD